MKKCNQKSFQNAIWPANGEALLFGHFIVSNVAKLTAFAKVSRLSNRHSKILESKARFQIFFLNFVRKWPAGFLFVL